MIFTCNIHSILNDWVSIFRNFLIEIKSDFHNENRLKEEKNNQRRKIESGIYYVWCLHAMQRYFNWTDWLKHIANRSFVRSFMQERMKNKQAPMFTPPSYVLSIHCYHIIYLLIYMMIARWWKYWMKVIFLKIESKNWEWLL